MATCVCISILFRAQCSKINLVQAMISLLRNRHATKQVCACMFEFNILQFMYHTGINTSEKVTHVPIVFDLVDGTG